MKLYILASYIVFLFVMTEKNFTIDSQSPTAINTTLWCPEGRNSTTGFRYTPWLMTCWALCIDYTLVFLVKSLTSMMIPHVWDCLRWLYSLSQNSFIYSFIFNTEDVKSDSNLLSSTLFRSPSAFSHLSFAAAELKRLFHFWKTKYKPKLFYIPYSY